MRTRKWTKYICSFVVAAGLLLNAVLPVSATEALRASDVQFEMEVYSAKAEGMYNGTFFKKNNALYVNAETIEGMAELAIELDANGDPLRMERIDEPGAVFVVSDYETYAFEEQTFYPFVEAMTDLCINALYDTEQNCMYVIPAKNIWSMADKLEEMQDNRTYSMSYWRNAKHYDADASRFEAQVADIGRNLFTAPSAMYKYLSGDADYESYRTALWDIMLAPVDCGVTAGDSFVQELKIYKYMDIWKEVPEEGKLWGKIGGSSKLMGNAAAAINDASTVMQLEDNMAAVKFYYNIDNINESVANGIELIAVPVC